MIKRRLIPILLLSDGRMVKGCQFENFRDVGDPVTAARVYNAQKVDELVFLDIHPTTSSRERIYEIVQNAASECFMPLTVGGGVKSCADIKGYLDVGADKVAINSEAVRNPGLIEEASTTFGDQCVVLSVDYRKYEDGSREVFIDSGKTPTGLDPLVHIQDCVSRGAGEVILTCIDCEGTMTGYDLDYIEKVAEAVRVPVIANGGAGTLDHFHQVLISTKAAAVAAASIFHFTDQSPIKARFYLFNKGDQVRV